MNARDRICRRTWDPGWHHGLRNHYDVIVAGNSLHWFSLQRSTQSFAEISESLCPGGSFVFLEPVAAETTFAPRFAAWNRIRPGQHRPEDWTRFLVSSDTLLDYD